MIREYEISLITRGDLSDADHQKTAEKYEEILTRDGGTIINRDDWGVKKLCYPINRQYRGRYFMYDIAASAVNIAEAERLMRIDESVLRYMTVRISDTVDLEKRKTYFLKERPPLTSPEEPKKRSYN